MPINRADAKTELLRWHRWSVVLRAEGFQQRDGASLMASLERALEGSPNVPEVGSADGEWIEGPDYDGHAAEALIDGFAELVKTLMRSGLPHAVRLGHIFDAIEVLPMELMRVGPAHVEQALRGHAEAFPELVSMALMFRYRFRG
ncbi:MAG: hypothetical protein AAGA48_29860 [Myxococcota bacterium]